MNYRIHVQEEQKRFNWEQWLSQGFSLSVEGAKSFFNEEFDKELKKLLHHTPVILLHYNRYKKLKTSYYIISKKYQKDEFRLLFIFNNVKKKMDTID